MAKVGFFGKGVDLLVESVLLGGVVSLLCGLDRIAVMQLMISRPLVAASFAGWLLGAPELGLQVGVMLELLWLARLPVGAAVPPDDTQVAVAATVLAVIFCEVNPGAGTEMVVLCLLVCLPFGKIGQYFDHYSRQFNNRLPMTAELLIEQGLLRRAEMQHLRGLFSFTVAIFCTYMVVIGGGLILVPILWPLVQQYLTSSTQWLMLAWPLIGIAVILGTINVSRALTLFCAAFGMAFLLLWLV